MRVRSGVMHRMAICFSGVLVLMSLVEGWGVAWAAPVVQSPDLSSADSSSSMPAVRSAPAAEVSPNSAAGTVTAVPAAAASTAATADTASAAPAATTGQDRLAAQLPVSVPAPLSDSTPPPPPESSEVPEVIAHWISVRGNFTTQFSNIRASWVWAPPSKGLPEGTPLLHVDMIIDAPQEWDFKAAKADQGKFLSFERVDPKNPRTRRLIVDMAASLVIVDFEFQNQGKTQKVSLALTAQYVNPYIISSKKCPNYKISLTPLTKDGKHLYIGYSCTEFDNYLVLYFVRSRDAKWSVATLDKTGEHLSFKYKISKPQDDLVYDGRIMKVSTIDAADKLIEYDVYYRPATTPRKWSLSVGLAGTYFRYYEKLRTDMTQWGVTGKIGGNYRLIPKVLNIDANMFLTLYSFNVSPENVPSMRFRGINGRIGYRLPIELGVTEWSFLGGWYWWSQEVEDNRFGVNPLSGPQLFIQMNRAQKGKHAFYGYFKFAVISDSTNWFQLQNKELAIGGGYAFDASTSPILGTLDVARTQFAKGRNAMVLTTVSVGVTKRF